MPTATVDADASSVLSYIGRLYNEILARNASFPELEYQKEKFVDARHLLEAMMHCEEYKRRVRTLQDGRSSISLHRHASDRFSHVVSLGSHCITSSILKRWSLKRWSGPLDWTFSATGMAASCIEDRFATFLERKHHVFIPDPDRLVEPGGSYCDHLIYREAFSVKSVFNHRDARIESHFAAYSRATARINKVLDDNERVLYVCIATPGRTSDQDLLRLVYALRERSSRSMLLYINVHAPDHDRRYPIADLIHETAHVRGFDFYPISHMGPVNFPNPLDEVFLTSLIHEFTFLLRDYAP